jgi:phosphoglucomutase
MTNMHPLAGDRAPRSMLIDVPRLVTAYFVETPDPAIASQRVAFGTSGHRGSSLEKSFNEAHVLAISEAVCRYRASHGIGGPLFLGIDTHALSIPASATALEVLAAHGVDVMVAGDEYTPTPAVSHAILVWNRDRESGLADGIVVTPSHNPPDSGGFKYNPPHGGPADLAVTRWIEAEANRLLEAGIDHVKRVPFERARGAETTHRYDFLGTYVGDLASVIDLEAVRAAHVRIGADPLGGAGVHYWGAIAERYGLDLTVVNDTVDPTFAFMPLDWDGRIRMDPSSSYAMQGLLASKDRFDIAFGCDTDHDRHGIVTRTAGLLPPNDYLATAIDYLARHRPQWRADVSIGKTMVSSAMIDRVASSLARRLYEVPVGFKWFVDGLLHGALGFAGEESAGASFLRRDGTVWTTDKDGIVAALLAAEITARLGRDPGERYRELADALGRAAYRRVDAPATRAQKSALSRLSRDDVRAPELAGEQIQAVLTQAPGNGEPLGGIKVIARSAWFAARPSGTEDVYKIYAESFRDEHHLNDVVEQAQAIVDTALASQ